jgi:hypothetical protein
MSRLFVILIVMTLLSACQPSEEQPALSGVLWGGEGSRMVIRSAYEPKRLNDTLLIDHQGEFVWNPDTILPGFYFLEKDPDNHLVLIFTGDNTVHVDAQYINFPNKAKVNGSNHAEDFSKVETISKTWQKALQKTTAVTSDSGWIPTPVAVNITKRTT